MTGGRGGRGTGEGTVGGSCGERHTPASAPSSRVVQPRVEENVRKRDSLVSLHHEALPDKVLALGRESYPEAQFCPADLLVCLEGDVATHHVKEEDAQRPNGRLLTVIAGVADPLGRSIHSRACNEIIREFLT